MTIQAHESRSRARDDAAVEGSSRSWNMYMIAVRAAIVLALTIVVVVLFTRVGQRHEVLAVARTVPAGHVIESADLREVRLSRDPGVLTVAARDKRRVVGMVANGTLFSGSTLTWAALSDKSRALGENEAIVGVSLKPGSFPSELRAGDTVRVVQAGSNSGVRSEEATTLVQNARVLSAKRTAEPRAASSCRWPSRPNSRRLWPLAPRRAESRSQ
jgi:Flp pilus assembly protein CpaB